MRDVVTDLRNNFITSACTVLNRKVGHLRWRLIIPKAALFVIRLMNYLLQYLEDVT